MRMVQQCFDSHHILLLQLIDEQRKTNELLAELVKANKKK